MPRTSPRTPRARRIPARLAVLAMVTTMISALVGVAPAVAESSCTEDPVGDVILQADGSTTQEPRSDIVAVCVSYDEEELTVTVRVAEPTDPFTDPEWEGTATAIGAAVDIDGIGEEEGQEGAQGGEEFVINLGRFATAGQQGTGPPEVRAYIAGTQQLATTGSGECVYPAAFDGIRYVMRVPVECLANHPTDPGEPATVRVAPYVVYRSPLGSADEGTFDEIPVFPEYLGPFSQAPAPDTAVTRLSGPSRVETALAISRADFPQDGSATGLVLARQDASPDALAGAPLAVAVGGPLLLTTRTSLPEDVEAEIQRVLPSGGTVHLAGGTAAIGQEVADRLEELGYAVARAAGPTRYATSVEVAQATADDPDLIVVADGNGFADALVGGAFAAANDGVQVLSNGRALDETVAGYLQAHADAQIVAVGALAVEAVPDATPVAGEDPFTTSVAVAERYGDVSGVALASGTNFPDGLAGGAHAGRAGIPLLLSWPDVLPDPVESHLQSITPVQQAVLYGGTLALSQHIAAQAAEAVGPPTDPTDPDPGDAQADALVLSGDGLAPDAGVGDPVDQVIAAVAARVGDPTEDSGWVVGCSLDDETATNERYVDFGEDLRLLFYDDGSAQSFRSWRYSLPAEKGLQTERGVTPTTTNEEIPSAYPGATYEDGTFGPMWTIPDADGGPMVFLPADGAASTPIGDMHGGDVLFCE